MWLNAVWLASAQQISWGTIEAITVLCAFAIGVGGFFIGRKTAANAAGRESGTILTELRAVVSDIKEIKADVKEIHRENDVLANRVTALEVSFQHINPAGRK